VKELRSDNGTEFKNRTLEEFCNEKGFYQKNSSPYTVEQNGVAERRNRTLIEVARTIVRSPVINYFHVFGCRMHIHNHRDHLGKFDAKADDGFFLGYSPMAKAFMVFNIRRQEMEKTYHVTDCANMGTIRLQRDRRVLVMVAGLPSLRVADSHTGNHPEDDFTPLETIRRPYSVIRKRILFELEGETFEPERGAYDGEPFVDLLQSFLNLGRSSDWLTLSNRGGADVPKALIKLVTHLENWKGVDGEFNFLLKGGFNDNQGSLSMNNTSSDDDLPPVHASTSSFPEVGEKSKAAGKRKLVVDALREGSHHRARKALVQASKVAGDASTSLDVDSDHDIHGKFKLVYGVFLPLLTTLLMSFPFLLIALTEFPSARELKDPTDCH
ncbi:retrovirus-related pol polyprotein from transposon TNT 1-94, partial [Tanacetum coccineum]